MMIELTNQNKQNDSYFIIDFSMLKCLIGTNNIKIILDTGEDLAVANCKGKTWELSLNHNDNMTSTILR